MAHHAQLLIGTFTWAREQIDVPESTEHPDFSVRTFERMSIGDARTLIRDAHLMPVVGATRTFVLNAQAILHEAQNALLKLLEEPPTTARFFLVVPKEDILLPTLRSRLNLIAREERVVGENDAFQAFKELTLAERFSAIADRLKAEDVSWVESIVHGFELHAHASRKPDLIRDALMISSYIQTVGSSKKMLLEHLALLL